MKKVIAVAVAALLGISAFAQVGISVGGSFGFTYSSLKRNGLKGMDGVSFKFVPEVGFRLMDNLTVGASVGYIHGYAALGSFNMNDFRSLLNLGIGTASDLYLNKDNGQVMNAVTFSPFARFTFLQTKWVDLFVEGGPGYNLVIVKHEEYDEVNDESYISRDKVNIFEFAVRPGIALNLGDQFKITAKLGSLGWQMASVKEGSGSTYTLNRIGLDVDSFNLLLGVSYSF